MVTYAQLQSETWWGREIVTPELDQFGQWVREYFHVSADAIGNKGNNVHLNGSHRSQEWIKNSRYCTNRTYTVQSGLTAEQARHIAGEDITPNSTADMLLISKRIDKATRAGQLEEVVAWYGNLGGDQRVDGYDNIRNVAATSDSSHLWHLHLSLDRRVLRDLAAMRKIFNVLTGSTSQGAAAVSVLTTAEQAHLSNADEYGYQGNRSVDPIVVKGSQGEAVAVPNLLAQTKALVQQLVDRPAVAITPTPEQWQQFLDLVETTLAAKSGAAAREAVRELLVGAGAASLRSLNGGTLPA